MLVLGTIFFTLLGVIVGSFLNVVILRFNTGKGIGGRSMCLACKKQLTWQELIPIVSYFALKRQCKGCGVKVSWQYPLVEIATAVLFGCIFIQQSYLLYEGALCAFMLAMLTYLIVWSLLVVIFVYDLRHKIIPNVFAYSLAIITLGFYLVTTPTMIWFTMPWLLDTLAGLIFFFPFFALWFMSRGRWIGLGDGKLALSIGWLLGFTTGLSAIVLAFWIGALFAIGLMLLAKLKGRGSSITMKSEVPFGPFLIIGTLIGFFVPLDFFGIELLLSFM